MGLDQYLHGNKYLYGAQQQDDEGWDIVEVKVKLAYWRKHWALHNYITQAFNWQEDNPSDMELNIDQLHQLLEAARDPVKNYPNFLEGIGDPDFDQKKYTDECIADDTEQISRAIAFLTGPTVIGADREFTLRSVSYHASW